MRATPKLNRPTEILLYVEFREGRPFAIVTDRATYDVEWSKRDRCLYSHHSGSGGGHHVVDPRDVYWVAKGQTLLVATNKAPWRREFGPGEVVGKRLKTLPKGYSKATLIELVQSQDIECNWCSMCDSWIPTTDAGDHPCDHIHWCEGAGWWSTPDERCDPGCEECLAAGDPTKAETKVLGRIGEGHGLVADDWWSHTGYWDRMHPGRYYMLNDHWSLWLAQGYGKAAVEFFGRMV